MEQGGERTCSNDLAVSGNQAYAVAPSKFENHIWWLLELLELYKSCECSIHKQSRLQERPEVNPVIRDYQIFVVWPSLYSISAFTLILRAKISSSLKSFHRYNQSEAKGYALLIGPSAHETDVWVVIFAVFDRKFHRSEWKLQTKTPIRCKGAE